MDSTDNKRTVNNVMRHQYRVLTDEEKKEMEAIKRAKFLPAHDQIIRDVYPLFGSQGVINILPQFTGKQINMRAYTLGVKIGDGWQKKVAMAKQIGDAPADIQSPDLGPRSRHLYPNAVDRLAYARRWA